MNNFYHKVAIASICTALGLALGASEEAKAATISLTPTTTFGVEDWRTNFFDNPSDGKPDNYTNFAGPVLKGPYGEVKWFAEFSMSRFYSPSDILPSTKTFVSRAILQTVIYLGIPNSEFYNEPGLPFNYNPGLSSGYLRNLLRTNPGRLGLFGYVGNGRPDLSDFVGSEFFTSVDISSSSSGDILNFDVTSFLNQQISNGHQFSGFGIRALMNDDGSNAGGIRLGPDSSGIQPNLIVEIADVPEQPVPEPTTILSAAIALGWGGWLKRKNSIKQDKTQSRD